jgi:hypothetical protein
MSVLQSQLGAGDHFTGSRRTSTVSPNEGQSRGFQVGSSRRCLTSNPVSVNWSPESLLAIWLTISCNAKTVVGASPIMPGCLHTRKVFAAQPKGDSANFWEMLAPTGIANQLNERVVPILLTARVQAGRLRTLVGQAAHWPQSR